MKNPFFLGLALIGGLLIFGCLCGSHAAPLTQEQSVALLDQRLQILDPEKRVLIGAFDSAWSGTAVIIVNDTQWYSALPQTRRELARSLFDDWHQTYPQAVNLRFIDQNGNPAEH